MKTIDIIIQTKFVIKLFRNHITTLSKAKQTKTYKFFLEYWNILYFIKIVLGVHCDIYKSSYNRTCMFNQDDYMTGDFLYFYLKMLFIVLLWVHCDIHINFYNVS
jgi:hypothetical protein